MSGPPYAKHLQPLEAAEEEACLLGCFYIKNRSAVLVIIVINQAILGKKA